MHQTKHVYLKMCAKNMHSFFIS